MKRTLIVIGTLFLLAVLSAHAGKVTESQALMKARQFMAGKTFIHAKSRPLTRGDLSDTLLYVFNAEEKGFVIVSGDDATTPILGYSYDGVFDTDNMPEHVQSWIDLYAKQLAYLQEHPDAAITRGAVSGSAISPLLGDIAWNQSSPYNDLCPMDGDKRSVTGCVATAMAQIMYYHKWPEKTTREIPGYTTKTKGISVPSIGVSTIDWSKMLPTYSSSASDAQKRAVAELMLMCGTATEMDYQSDASGAYIPSAFDALKKYFDYDPHMVSLSRRSNDESWHQLIYNELSENRPVIYRGNKFDLPGHAFIIDGYDKNNYFHVNWGWGGSKNGYFLLELMRPYDQDDYDFSEGQEAIIGIQRPTGVELYAAYNNSTLTFYNDNQRSNRQGTTYDLVDDRGWLEHKESITKAVIDASFADFAPTSFTWFMRLSALQGISGLEYLNTERMWSMANMFYGCSSLTTLDLSHFNTQNVTKMSFMFESCSSLTSLDLSHFKTQNVTDMCGMFERCSALAKIDVSSFDTQNVTDMRSMFYGCSSLTELDLSSFNPQNVTRMGSMFGNCRNLSAIYASEKNWNTANVTESDHMFIICEKLKGGNGTTYDANHTDAEYARIDKAGTPGYLTEKNGDTPTPAGDAEAYVVYKDGTLTFYYDNQRSSRKETTYDLYDQYKMPGWKELNKDITTVVFNNSFSNTRPTTTSNWFDGCTLLINIQGINYLNTSEVTDMGSMFRSCSSLASLDVSNFTTSKVTNMGGMFQGCKSLTSIEVDNFNTSSVINMYGMFANCSNLTNLNVSGFDTQNIKLFTYMFDRCSSLTTLDVSGFNTKNAESMFAMFSGCSSLVSLDVSGFETSKVDNMTYMFDKCSNLKSLDVSGFNTSNVTGMQAMFRNCSSLTTLDVSGFDTKNVKDMGEMFYKCSSLASLDVSSFDTRNVETMVGMFYFCQKMANLILGSQFTTVESTETANAFTGCSGLSQVTFKGDVPASIGNNFFNGVGKDTAPVLLVVPEQYKSHYEAKFNGNMFFGGYFTLNTSTGIKGVTLDESGESRIYDLRGRRLEKPAKGINIINGRKVVVK